MALLRKIGIGVSDDPQYTAVKKDFEESKKSLDKVNEHVTAFLLVCQDILHSQKKVAEDMSSTKGADVKTLPDGMVKDNIMLLDRMMLEKTRVDEEIRRGFQDPLNKYKQQYRELEERMRERSRRQEDMLKLEDDVKKYKQKNDARLAGAERRLASTKQGFEDLHNELLEDIPRLIEDKAKFFEPLIAVLIDAQIHFYQRMFEQLAEIQSRITHIDRSSASSHPRVIRGRNESAVGKSYSSFGGSGSHVASRPDSHAATTSNNNNNNNNYYEASTPYGTTASSGYPSTAPMGAAPPPVPSRAVPSIPPPSSQPRARGMWDFATVQPNELPFKAGDVLNLIDTSSPDWWMAEMNGRQGLIPANYVQMI